MAGIRSLAEQMVAADVPNVLSWGGSVFDDSATQFARGFYGRLADRLTVHVAAALARQDLAREEDKAADRRVPHWPLARIHVGREGGGALVGSATTNRSWVSLDVHEQFGEGSERLPVRPGTGSSAGGRTCKRLCGRCATARGC